jgi:hypothetical protein
VYEGADLVEDLAHVAPGPELAALLSTLDYDQLPPDVRVDALCAEARQGAHQQARLLTAMVKAAQVCPLGEDFGADEISFALHWTRQAAQGQLALAQELTGRLPAVHAALLAGTIDLPKARVILDATRTLDDGLARQVAEQILPLAGGLTTGELRPRLRRLVITVDPDAAAKRQEQAVRDRRVECYPDPDGTATLLGTGLPAERAKAAANRIDQLARAAKQSGDDRSMHQLRADTMLDLLDGTHAGREIDARIEVTVPLATLLELKDAPGDLAGYGPLVADIARHLVENPASGQIARPVRFGGRGDPRRDQA